MMKRFHVIFKGDVQGVGFRYTVSELARKYDLTGSVENLSDGTVEVYFQGDEEAVKAAIADATDPLRYIYVTDTVIREEEVNYYEHFFTTRY